MSDVVAVELLRELVSTIKARDDAKSDAEILIPEQDTEWPDGYDFDALERAQSEADAAETKYEDLLVRVENYLKVFG